MKIGIPRALMYYDYYPFWKYYFSELGHQTVLSIESNKQVLDNGVKLCVDDACLPIKLFHGHCFYLSDKCDVIFIPRFISIKKKEYMCPKIIGLKDMIKFMLPHTRLLTVDIDCYKNKNAEMNSYINLAKQLGNSSHRAKKIILNAMNYVNNESSYQCFNTKGIDYESNKSMLIVGHKYLVFDKYASMNIVEKIKNYGYNVLFANDANQTEVNNAMIRFKKRMFWTVGRQLLGGGISLADKMLAGVIFISSFGCGIDSFICELLERNIKKENDIPYLNLNFDEHSGEAGIDTRLEAFFDMIEWRREEYGYNFSAYGRGIHSSKNSS